MGLAVMAVLIVACAPWLLRRMAAGCEPPQAVPGTVGVYQIHGVLADFHAARTEDGVVLFDAGADPTGKVLDKLLTAAGAQRTDVRHLFVTHGHFDHIAAATLLPGARIWAAPNDAALMRGEGGRGLFVSRLLSMLIGIPRVVPTDAVDSRREIPTSRSGDTVLAISAPGHTVGSVMYLYRRVLFAGDALVYQSGRLALVSERFADDAAQARLSIARLPSILGTADLQTICTGHGGCTPPGTARALLDELVLRLQN
jgi:hydroxyacylglutathione hydrolase